MADKFRINPLGLPFDAVRNSLADLGTRPHSALTSLSDDDHAQYLLLAGRSGGQTVIGGTAPSESLVLQSTSHATRDNVKVLDTFQVLAEDKTYTAAPTPFVQAKSDRTYIADYVNCSFPSAYSVTSIFQLKQTASGFGMGSLFSSAGTFENEPASVANMAAYYTFIDLATYRANTQTITNPLSQSLRSSPTFTVANGGTFNVTTWENIFIGGTVNAGVTVTTHRGIRITNPAVTGTLTTNYGIDIDAQTGGATNIGIRNNATLRQVSKAVFGANVEPSYDISLGGAAARTIGMERHTTANTAGNALTVQAGGATSGATNKAGGSLLIQNGVGTGNATPSKIEIAAPAQGTASGTTDQTNVMRIGINGTKALTSGSATTIATIPLASLQMGSGILIFGCEATDGTDMIAYSSSVYFSVVNKAAVYTSTATQLGANLAKSDAADTYTVAFSFVSGTNTIDLKITPTLTGMTATTHRMTYTVISFAQQDVTI